MHNLLSYIFLFPLVIALVMLFISSENWKVFRSLNLATVSVQLALSIVLLVHFEQNLTPQSWSDGFQFVEKVDWINLSLGTLADFKIQYYLGVDGISLPLVVLSSFVLLIGVISSWNIKEKAKGYHVLYLVLSASVVGCFVSLDFFLFYLCFEFMLLPMFFLIGIWGGERRSYASIKFLLYTLFGSLFILVVMIGLYMSIEEGGINSFSITAMLDGKYVDGSILDPNGGGEIMGHSARAIAFIFLLIGFGIKLPSVPVHTWLPDAHVEAPTPISVILAGLLLKVGAYGLFRILYSVFPDMAIEYASWVAFLGVLSILYGGLNALAQRDLKKMVAYSSVSHMGFVLVGLASMTSVGLSGALFHMISHGLISPALFLLVGVLYDRTHNRLMDSFSGLASKMPAFTFFVALFFFAGLGLPGMSGFVGELMVLMGAFSTTLFGQKLAFLAILGIIISAAYFLWTIQRVFFGTYFVRVPEWNEHMSDLTIREKIMLFPLALLVVILGVYPRFVMDYSQYSIEYFLNQISKLAP